MSLPPITLDDLTQATAIDPANDLLLVRQGTQDFKATVDQIAALNMALLSLIPTSIQPTDRIIVGKAIGGGNFQNYYATLEYFGFPSGTKMYFYQQNPPAGWTLDATVQDRLLAVRGGAGDYAASGLFGTWQQTPYALTPAQIPAHSHRVKTGLGSSSSVGSTNAARGANSDSPGIQVFTDNGATGPGGSDQLLGQAHNHGNTWRPAAAVGCIGDKN